MKDRHLFILILTITSTTTSVFAGVAYCTFEHTSRYSSELITNELSGYVCNLDLDFKGQRVDDVGGGHEGGENDNFVSIIRVKPDFYNYLTSYPNTFCSRFKKLEIIDMGKCDLKTIEENALNDCKDLRILQFYMNKIESIPEKMLSENKKLLRLFINFNSIRTLPETSLNGLSELQILDLSYNFIDDLPDKLFKDLINLKELTLEVNKIENLPNNLFSKLKNLQTLNLNKNSISELPVGIFNGLNSLKYLYIQRNKLNVIHADSFPENIKIDLVSLTKNKIEAIDAYFIEACDVQSIEMTGNICDKTKTVRRSQMNKKLKSCFDNYNAAAEVKLDDSTTTTTTVRSTTTTKTTTEKPTTTTRETTKKPTTTARTTTKKSITTTRTTTETTTRTTTEPTTTTTTPKPGSKPLEPWKSSCGEAKAAVPNIVGGIEINKGTHPWIAALIDKNGVYFCGGTLVSKRLVVTAAHCIHNKNSVVKTPGDFTVVLGAHNLDNMNEVGRKTYLVSDIQMDRNWNPNTNKFDADIAVLLMNEEVKFGAWIQPVCLPKFGAKLKSFNYGVVVGFGKTENAGPHSNVPMKANMPIYKSDDCYYEFPNLMNIASYRTFCAGFANGTGACMGDSGGGLTVVQDDVHYLRGIVSASLHGTKYGCNVESYSIFTDIRFYIQFIKDLDY